MNACWICHCYRTRIVCHWIIYGYKYAPMIRSFVYHALVSCMVRSFRVSCIRFVYRAIVRVKRLFVFRSFAFRAYCKLIWSRICNNELFSIYYRIFYELWTFADFDRLCKLQKRGDEIKNNLLLWNYWANLNLTLLKWFLGGPLPKLCLAFQTSDQDGHYIWT